MTWLWSAVGIAGLMFLLWMYSLWSKDASIVDRWWAIGFVVAAIAGGQRSWILIPLMLWAARLSLHLTIRNWGKPDARYEDWRRKYPNWPIRSLFQVFVLQGVLLYLASIPVVHGQPHGVLAWIGLGVFAVGFVVETIADWQLARHEGPAVLQNGLWGKSRHPNYLGEAIVWIGFGLIAVSGGPWWSAIGSVVVYVLVRHVSGTPMLEKRMEGREKYREYRKDVPIFWPFRF